MMYFLLGFHAAGVLCSFLFIGFFCVLGGRNEDLWKPFVYSLGWEITVPMFLAGWI